MISIKKRVFEEKEIEITKTTLLKDVEGEKVYCEVKKVIYIADKLYFKEKRRLK
ncbi:MAG: hypothetical protein AAFN93_13235 [Bacteroidota bacterium]